MARAGKSRLRFSGLREAADDLGRGQKLRATADQRAALAGALPENLLTRRRDRAVGPETDIGHLIRLLRRASSHAASSRSATFFIRGSIIRKIAPCGSAEETTS